MSHSPKRAIIEEQSRKESRESSSLPKLAVQPTEDDTPLGESTREEEKLDKMEKTCADESVGACGGISEYCKPLRLIVDPYHCDVSDEPTTESEMCTEESVEKMTSSTEGMVSLSEDSSGRDTYAQAATAVYSWPVAAHSDTIDLDDSDDQMNGLMGSYREISMDEEDDGTRDEDMHADTEEEVSNLSNDSNEEENDVTESDENRRPSSLNLLKTQSMTSSDCTRSVSSLSSALVDENKAASGPLSELPGTLTKDGDMVMFVVEDLNAKIKMHSPITKRETPPFGSQSSTPSLYKQALTPQLPPIDVSVISDLESQAKKIAANLDGMLENLSGTLHSMSSLTVDCMDTYRNCVCKTCDVTDISIKSMYQLMAKCEELGNAMRPVYRLADQIKEIKRLLDLFESVMNSS